MTRIYYTGADARRTKADPIRPREEEGDARVHERTGSLGPGKYPRRGGEKENLILEF